MEPNRSLYDIGDNLNLSCQAEENTNLYTIKWYKKSSEGSFEEQESTLKTNGIYTQTLSLKKMSEPKVTYKCIIGRYPVNYSDYKMVTVELKGNKNIV